MFENLKRLNPWSKWYPQPSFERGRILLIDDTVPGVYKSSSVGVIDYLRNDLHIKMAILEPGEIPDPGLHRRLSHLAENEGSAVRLRNDSLPPHCPNAMYVWNDIFLKRDWVPQITKWFPRPRNRLQLEMRKISRDFEILASDILFSLRLVERANPFSTWFLTHLDILFDNNPNNVRVLPCDQMPEAVILEKTYAGLPLVQFAFTDSKYVYSPKAGEIIFWKPESGVEKEYQQPIRPFKGPWIHLTIEPCEKPGI